MRQIFLDTETTGLDASAGDRIIEIGCLEMVNRRLTGRRLHHYLNPERRSHEDAVKVHGLTDEFLADKPKFAQVCDEVLEFLHGADVVIHNAPFDVGFLEAELRRVGKAPFAARVARVTDTLTMAREMFPGKSNSLDALCRRFEVDNSHRDLHGALIDAALLAEVYLRMTRGQESLVMNDDSRGAAAADAGAGAATVDLRGLDLTIVAASADELAAHVSLIADIDKSSGGRAVWKPPVA